MQRWFAAILFLTLSLPALSQNRITILNDAFGKQSNLELDWGYSALIEFEGKRILFDTGDNIALFQRNIARMHVDLSHLDMVILSHAHGDHTSGLRYVLALNPNVLLYVPEDPYFTGSTLPPAFLTTDAQPDLPSEMRYFRGGTRPPGLKGSSAWTDTKMTSISGYTEIAPHIRLVSLVSDKPAFRGLREISLILDTPKGPVVIAGCSHPGIENIMAAANLTKPVAMLFGGLHLLQDSTEQIDRTLDVLDGQYHVQTMAVGHCTGELAFKKIQQKWTGHTIYAGLGETIRF